MRDPGGCKSVEQKPNRNLMKHELVSYLNNVEHTGIGRFLHSMSRVDGITKKGVVGEAVQKRCFFHHLEYGMLDRRAG
jgi:hypothetical protein